MSKRFRGMCLAASLLVTVQAAFGQGVGPGGPFETTHVLQSVGRLDIHSPWRLATAGSPANPIAVELDPTGPAWLKHLELPVSGSILPQQPIIAIVENLVASGDRAWTGWRTEILTPDFEWYVVPLPAFIANGLSASGLAIDTAPAGVPPGKGLAFSFDPLSTGTQIEIYRKLVYTGSVPFTGTITVRDFPTPEPATILLGVAGALAGFRCHHTGRGVVLAHPREHEGVLVAPLNGKESA